MTLPPDTTPDANGWRDRATAGSPEPDFLSHRRVSSSHATDNSESVSAPSAFYPSSGAFPVAPVGQLAAHWSEGSAALHSNHGAPSRAMPAAGAHPEPHNAPAATPFFDAWSISREQWWRP